MPGEQVHFGQAFFWTCGKRENARRTSLLWAGIVPELRQFGRAVKIVF